MNKIKIKHRYTDKIVFEYETENNTIKKTVEEAVRQEVNLHAADLSEADLSGAKLNSANLEYADLREADLSNADLSGANCDYADLRSANLSGTNLANAIFLIRNITNNDQFSIKRLNTLI